MPLVREDHWGLYVESGGYIARPVDGVSQFKVGDKPESRHFGGSGVHGVGRSSDLGRGDFLEYWFSCGEALNHPRRGGDLDAFNKTHRWYVESSSHVLHAQLRALAQELRRNRQGT